MSLEKNKQKTKSLVMTALFAAIMIVLQYLPIPPIGGLVGLNFSLVPLVLGAVLFGPLYGAVLGAIMGAVIVSQIIMMPHIAGNLAVGMYIMNPVVTIALCLIKTSVAGAVSGLVAKYFTKVKRAVAVIIASALCPIINTGIFLTGLCGIFSDVLVANTPAGYTPMMFVLIFIVLCNFVPELIINIVASPIIVRVTETVKKKV